MLLLLHITTDAISNSIIFHFYHKKNNLEVKKFITTLVSIKHVLAISICKACTINDRRRTKMFLDSYNKDSLNIINFSTTEYEAYCIIYKLDFSLITFE